MIESGSDQDLLHRFVREHSEDAFAALVKRHVNLVYGAALRQLANPHQAQEVTQVVFVILARKASLLGPGVILPGWLYQTTRHAVANARRSDARRRRMEETMATLQSDPASPASSLLDQVAPILDESMASLTESDRNALVLHFLENRPLREVGEVFGSSEDAAQKRVSRALEKLRLLLKRRGVAVSAIALAGALQGCAAQSAPAGVAAAISIPLIQSLPAGIATFTQETLKLMAWTQTKTALVATVVVMLLGGAGTSYLLLNQDKPLPAGVLAGAWEGVIEVTNAVKLRLVTHLESKPDGSYKATLDSIDQGIAGIPVPAFEVKGRKIQLSMPALGAKFEGELDRDLKKWTGQWSQLNFKAPLTLAKTDTPTQIAKAPVGVSYERRRDFDPQGQWEGSLRLPGVVLRLRMKIHGTQDGGFAGTLDSIDQGARDLAMTKVSLQESNLVVELTSIAAKYEGTIDRAAGLIEGSWSQGGKSFDLDFKRTTLAAPGEQISKNATNHVLAGSWRGTIKVKDTQLRVRMKFAGTDSGGVSVTLDSLDQGARDIPATVASYEEEELRVEWKGFASIFTAKLDGEALVGQWKQGPLSLPLTLQREEVEAK